MGMLRVRESKSGGAAVDYLREGLSRNDYYREGEKIQGEWLGRGAERLGLSGGVEDKDFIALVRNRNPKTGEKLTVRDKINRRPGYDATLLSWKAGSIMSGVFGCSDVRESFERAGDQMMTEKAEPMMHTRVRRRGQDLDRVTGEMVCAGFLHDKTRPVKGKSDPHDHKHYYILNATFDGDEGRWKAAQMGFLKENGPELELYFDALYGKELLALGYVPTMGRYGPTIKGVPDSVIKKFSENSNRIEKESAELGITDAAGKRKLADSLRESKKRDLPWEKLHAEWLDRLTPEEFAALEKVKKKLIDPGPKITPHQAVEFAVNHLFQREDVVTERKLRKTALHYGIGYMMPEDVDKEIAAALGRGEIRAKDGEKGRNFVKTSTLRDQAKMTHLSRDGIGLYEPLAKQYEEHADLSKEQNAVARSIVESRDKYMGFRGPAGTGKSYSLKGVDAAIKQRHADGEDTFARALLLAPSTSASRVEGRKAGFKDANTLAAFFNSQKMQADMRDQFLIVDESGMMSTKDMIALMKIAEENNNRVLFIGDYKQHASIDAGDAFRLLQKEGGLKYAELTENRRQKKHEHRDAVDAMATGTEKGVLKGFSLLDKMGAVVVEPDREVLRERLTAAYLKSADEGRTGLIITPTHAEAALLTDDLRRALKARGAIVGDERIMPVRKATGWTDAQKQDSRNYQPGMVVAFHRATPGVRRSAGGKRETVGGFKQGETAMVLQGGKEVLLARTDGTTLPLPAEHAERFEVYTTEHQGFARGDRLRITKNGKVKVDGQHAGTSVNNGDIFSIDGFTKEGDFRLPGGKVLSKNYGHIAYGYTATSQRSQGSTVDDEFIDWNRDALMPVDKQAAYVTSSRFRENITIFVNDKEAVKKAMVRGGQRMTALELMKDDIGVEKVTVEKRFSFHRHIEVNRIRGYLRKPVDMARQAARNISDIWKQRGQQHG